MPCLQTIIRHRLTIFSFLTVFCITPLLTGCVTALVGTSLVASSAIIYDKRPAKRAYNDRVLTQQITTFLHEESKKQQEMHVSAVVFNGVLLLIGEVSNNSTKYHIQSLVQTVYGNQLRKTYNALTLSGNTSWLNRTNDAWITSKVKIAILHTKHIHTGQIKVVTESGTVYLLGLLRRETAQKAIAVSRHVPGVQKVVSAFEYTD